MTMRIAMLLGCVTLVAAFAPDLASAQDFSSAVKRSPPPSQRLLPRFPDFGQFPPPDKYQGRIFKLSQDFPTRKPSLDAGVRKILSIDFYKDWKAYAEAVRDYIYEGNIEADGVANDFYLEDNKVRRWYHVPWQHWGDFGREGIHGLTKEGPVMPLTLSPSQPGTWQTYAVGFYNEPGGYMIGRVWADQENPRVDVMQSEGFPVGTVVGKVLFTTAPVSEVPFLTNPIEWLAYTTENFTPINMKPPYTKRVMNTVRFIQMDIMVRDPRADATGGWVFGTFVYNGALAKPNLWHNVVPVGLMWGNDPTVTSYPDSNPAPVKTIINPDLKQTVINTSADLPPMHLGFGLRLNGPVDNTQSSCMSCHSTAQYPQITPILPNMVKKDGVPPQAGHSGMDAFLPQHPVCDAVRPAGHLDGLLAAARGQHPEFPRRAHVRNRRLVQRAVLERTADQADLRFARRRPREDTGAARTADAEMIQRAFIEPGTEPCRKHRTTTNRLR